MSEPNIHNDRKVHVTLFSSHSLAGIMGRSKQNKTQPKKVDGKYRPETREERRVRLQQQEESRQVRGLCRIPQCFVVILWWLIGLFDIRVGIVCMCCVCVIDLTCRVLVPFVASTSFISSLSSCHSIGVCTLWLDGWVS
jgi:hypothetical protein